MCHVLLFYGYLLSLSVSINMNVKEYTPRDQTMNMWQNKETRYVLNYSIELYACWSAKPLSVYIKRSSMAYRMKHRSFPQALTHLFKILNWTKLANANVVSFDAMFIYIKTDFASVHFIFIYMQG